MIIPNLKEIIENQIRFIQIGVTFNNLMTHQEDNRTGWNMRNLLEKVSEKNIQHIYGVLAFNALEAKKQNYSNKELLFTLQKSLHHEDGEALHGTDDIPQRVKDLTKKHEKEKEIVKLVYENLPPEFQKKHLDFWLAYETSQERNLDKVETSFQAEIYKTSRKKWLDNPCLECKNGKPTKKIITTKKGLKNFLPYDKKRLKDNARSLELLKTIEEFSNKMESEENMTSFLKTADPVITSYLFYNQFKFMLTEDDEVIADHLYARTVMSLLINEQLGNNLDELKIFNAGFNPNLGNLIPKNPGYRMKHPINEYPLEDKLGLFNNQDNNSNEACFVKKIGTLIKELHSFNKYKIE